MCVVFTPMQPLVSDDVYQFTPPKESRFWPWVLGLWIGGHLRRKWGIEQVEYHDLDLLEKSLAEGSGVLLAPNHCRPCDPLVLAMLSKQMKRPFNIMASGHLFRSRFLAWLLPRVGAFSVNREGMDRESLKTAIGILSTAKRPLVVFPEGVISRTNDRVVHLQEGISFLARSAAKARTDSGGKVVIHPLALRYQFLGDWQESVRPVVDALESRFGWKRSTAPMIDRVARLGHGLLGLKEVEFFGVVQEGNIGERLHRFMERVLTPIENEYLAGRADESVVMRVKNIRKALLPGLVAGDLSDDEREKRWKILFDLEVAQQAFHFPPDYIAQDPSPERMIETVERYQEALGIKSPVIHRPMKVIVTVGEAMTVEARRDKGVEDTLMAELRGRIKNLLGISAT